MDNIDSYCCCASRKLENHVAVTSADFVKQACIPLIKNLGVGYFSFYRDFKDGSRIWFCTHANWTNYLYQKKYCAINNFNTKKITTKNRSYFLWNSLIDLIESRNDRLSYIERLQDARNSFNIDNGFSIIEHHDFYKDFFNFAAANANFSADKYFNNLNTLIAFSTYFKDVAANLIRQAMQQRIIIHEKQKNICPSLIKTSYNHYLISHDNQNYILTPREEECLALLSCGKTAKMIAATLHLSNRTVENYINIVKEKLNCHNKTKLIEIYYKNNPDISYEAILTRYLLKQNR